MTEVERQELYMKVVFSTLPMSTADLAILRVYQHGRTSIRVLRDELRKINAKLTATGNVMWQWPEESVHWEDALATYKSKFRSSLSL